MEIITSILIRITLISVIPLLVGCAWEILLLIYDLIRGNCYNRSYDKFLEILWKYFIVILILFGIDSIFLLLTFIIRFMSRR